MFVIAFAITVISLFMVPDIRFGIMLARVWLNFEMAVPVFTPGAACAHSIATDVFYVSWDIADAETNAAVVRAVRFRTVDHQRVVKRKLSCPKRGCGCIGVVEWFGYRLAAVIDTAKDGLWCVT